MLIISVFAGRLLLDLALVSNTPALIFASLLSNPSFSSWRKTSKSQVAEVGEKMSTSVKRKLNGEAEEDEDEDDLDGDGLEAWERTYADERSWENLQEDESGLLRPIDNTAIYHSQYRRRLRSLSSTATAARIQKGLIRFLYIVVDLSRVCEFCFFVELLNFQ